MRLQVAHIEADSRERVAQIQAQRRQNLDSMSGRLNLFDNKD